MDKNKIRTLLSAILVAKIVEITKHPDADKLLIVQVDIGTSENIQIVTGADNVQVGDYVPFLGVGEIVPGLLISEGKEFKLEKRALRGVMSNGMILSGDEIGINKDHTGIVILQEMSDENIGKSIVEVWNGLVEEVARFNQQQDSILDGIKSVTTEILGEDDLKTLLLSGEKVNHYIGFEISGLIHLGQGLMSGLVIRELQKLGVHTRIFLADWHTWINNKLNGDINLIHKVANEYFAPAIKIATKIAGGDPDKIEVIEGSDLYHNNDSYWKEVIDVSKNLTLSRVLKSTTILGREASQSMEFAMLIYPSMQAADIFEMQNHIAHAGTDQRNVHVIAREVADKVTVKKLVNPINQQPMKPIAIHHELVPGLQKPAQWPLPENIDKKAMLTSLKMSKSIPDSAIFIQDSEEDIRRKITKAFCPEKEIGYNPVLSWVRLLIFPIKGEFNLKREEKFGGDRTYLSFDELEKDYFEGEIFPLDLKNNVADILVELLRPARETFANEESQKLIRQILEVKKKR